MQSNGTFTFQKPNHMGYHLFGMKTLTQMHLVHHRMPFDQSDTNLLAQISKISPNLRRTLPKRTFRRYLEPKQHDIHTILSQSGGD